MMAAVAEARSAATEAQSGYKCKAVAVVPGGTYKIFYHAGFHGRALGLFMMLEEAGAKYEWLAPGDYPDKGFACPMFESPTGVKCSQTIAVSFALGKELGFYPDELSEQAKALQLCNDVSDMFGEVMGGKPDERIKKWLQHFEDSLTGEYFCGDKPTYADFNIFMNFTGISQQKAPLMEGCPKLQAWIDKMKNRESNIKLKEIAPFLPESMGGLKLL